MTRDRGRWPPSHHVSEPLRQQVQGRRAVGGDEGVDVHDHADAVCDSIRGAGHGHAPIAGSAQHHLVEILELKHGHDILHVRGKAHIGSQVDTLAHARQGEGEDDVTLHPQRQRHRCPFPAAAEAAVNNHERRHCGKPLILGELCPLCCRQRRFTMADEGERCGERPSVRGPGRRAGHVDRAGRVRCRRPRERDRRRREVGAVRAFVETSAAAGAATMLLDCRAVEPTERGFLRAVGDFEDVDLSARTSSRSPDPRAGPRPLRGVPADGHVAAQRARAGAARDGRARHRRPGAAGRRLVPGRAVPRHSAGSSRRARRLFAPRVPGRARGCGTTS